MSQDLKYIYEKYSKSIFRYLIILTKNELLSEELTQETFYQAIKCIDKFNGECSIYTWLCAIAKNCYKQHIRNNKKYLYTDNIDLFSTQPSKPNKNLYKAISKLNSPYREIVQLHIYDDLTLKEIGERLNKSESYARVMFHRAKAMLRKEVLKDEM